MVSTTPAISPSLELELHLLPLADAEARQASVQRLRQGLDPLDLQALLSRSGDETDSRELSLEELEELTGGVGLVDAMVSSSILMVIVSQSAGLFGNSMNAISNSKLRDGLNAAISADLELVRHEVADWASAAQVDGQIRYAPDEASCSAGNLGETLLLDKSTELPVASTIDLSSAPTTLKGVTINRSIAVDPTNKNLIKISYATTDGSAISVNQSTTLSTPAQGWCA